MNEVTTMIAFLSFLTLKKYVELFQSMILYCDLNVLKLRDRWREIQYRTNTIKTSFVTGLQFYQMLHISPKTLRLHFIIKLYGKLKSFLEIPSYTTTPPMHALKLFIVP